MKETTRKERRRQEQNEKTIRSIVYACCTPTCIYISHRDGRSMSVSISLEGIQTFETAGAASSAQSFYVLPIQPTDRLDERRH